jgi:hypothetical protein
MALGQPLGAPALVGRRSCVPVLLLRRPALVRILDLGVLWLGLGFQVAQPHVRICHQAYGGGGA